MSPPTALPLLLELVSLPSVNPMGRAVGDGPPYFEGRVSDYLDAYFRDLGVPYERRTISPGRDNLIARFEPPGGKARRTLLWDAHQDTVPAEGMTVEPFRPVVDGGKVFGRGSCDVKGGLAAMLAAFARLVRERPEGAARVLMACTVDEEYTHTGSSALAAQGLAVDLAVVAEPTMLRVVTAHKGAVRWKVVTEGVACHSSRPQDGVNAIYRMARVLSVIEPFALCLREATPDPVLGPPTLSVGRIEGGQSVNVVPDSCAIDLDRRVIPGEDVEGVRRQLQDALVAALGDSAPFSFTEPWVRMPSLSPESSRGWVEPVRDAMARALGERPEISAVPYGTDAGPLSASGIPALVIGPGDIAQAHTKDEWIAVDQLERAVEAYYALACHLGNADPT
ncbi:M20 family metallopeptidase [Tautonia plasticadhaerens]|uniref:Acetylornithine deacetylase n=1 Tax=Tautonia plasticadhaerens TaxID=2527974 RepID=A0A518GYH3_9BACT|nr:M20 family metallopeptidase [Tautonia plasticadhaerens]QDV33649.1 Acetylornithine deacetylase [Tautonia plasticadhaerens]